MKTPDDIIDIEVDTREEVRKGKTPRRLFVTIGALCIVVLMVLAIIFNNNHDPVKQKNTSDIKGEEAKNAVAQSRENPVELAAAAQTASALQLVKGGMQASSAQGSNHEGENQDLNHLRGDGSASNSQVRGNQHAENGSNTKEPSQAEDVANRKRESIRVAGIFKGGGAQAAQTGPQNDSADLDILKRLNATPEMRQTLPPDLASLASLRSAPPKTSSQIESEFNASMESRKLPSPTGIIDKTNSNCLLRPGWLVPVANMEAMNSDIPGEVTLVVRQNVYGSYNNRCLAIPAGSTIQATYNPSVVVGQERFNIAASVMYLPNGRKVPMLGTNAYDLQGSAGVEADVNNHFFKLVGTSLLIGAAARLSGNDGTSSSTSNGQTTTNSTVVGKVFGDTAQTILDRNKNMTPTLTRAGASRFNLILSREFLMDDYRD